MQNSLSNATNVNPFEPSEGGRFVIGAGRSITTLQHSLSGGLFGTTNFNNNISDIK
jgi:hypothetical protein